MAAAMQPLLQRQASQQQDLLNSLGIPHTMAPSDVHVLLVDDERLSRMVVGNVLRKCNYRGARPDSLVPTLRLNYTRTQLRNCTALDLKRFIIFLLFGSAAMPAGCTMFRMSWPV